MRHTRAFLGVLVLTGAALVAAGAPAAAAPAAAFCKPEYLPVPPDTVQSGVSGGDLSGRYVVGSALVNPGGAPSKVHLIWKTGKPSVVTLPYRDAGLSDVNRSGVAVGTGTDAQGRWHAFMLVDGGVKELPSPDPAYETRAIAINDRGDVAGTIYQAGTDWIERAVRWPADNPGTVEEVPVEGTVSVADIAADGTVLAQTGGPFNPGPAIVWGPTGDVAKLPSPGGGTSIGVAIAGDFVTGWENAKGASNSLRWNLLKGEVIGIPEVDFPQAVNAAGAVGGQTAGFGPVIRKADGTVVHPDTGGAGGGVAVLADSGLAYGFVSGQAVSWLGC